MNKNTIKLLKKLIKEEHAKLINEKSNADKLAKELDFSEARDYYDYIEESAINGQRKQSLDLFNDLNSDGKKEFLADREMYPESVEYILANIF